MKNKVLFFLDKEWPPRHSFVDGFICSDTLRKEIEPTLVVTRQSSGNKEERYRHVACLCYLSPRRGFGRVFRFFESIKIVRNFRQNQNSDVVFIRNDPLILLAMSFMKKLGFIRKIVYQNSFPHEVNSWFAGLLAKIIFRLAFPMVDKVYVVAEGAQRRLSGYSADLDFRVVSLLLQDDMIKSNIVQIGSGEKIRFIYAGTLASPRKIDFFLHAFAEARKLSSHFIIDIVGGEEREINALLELDFVQAMVQQGYLSFLGKVVRTEVSDYLLRSHIGISVIPPTDMYKESSPTKLGEYLGHGLPVLVTSGIPFQDAIARQTEACHMVEYSEQAIVSAIISLVSEPEKLTLMSRHAVKFSSENLAYTNVVISASEDFL